MYRSEKRNAFIGIVLVAVLIATIFAGVYRMNVAKGHLSGTSISIASDTYGSVVTRDGTVVSEDGNTYYGKLLHNVVGAYDASGNTLINAYGDMMAPEISVMGGIRNVSEGNRVTTTLLSPNVLQQVADAFGTKGGACYAYNYVTGEVLCLLSVDGETSFSANRCLTGLYTPGSTMKVVTSILAIDQDPGFPASFAGTCEGTMKVSDVKIVCAGDHASTDFCEALGQSCNCSFAQIAASLDPSLTMKGLQQLGFDTDMDHSYDLEKVSQLTKSQCSTLYEGSGGYDDLWGLVGQGKTLVNLMDMARIAGAVANGGAAAQPYLVEKVTTVEGDYIYAAETGVMTQLFSGETADIMSAAWEDAFDTYYTAGSRELDELYSYCKTGTAQLGGGVENKLLLGVSESAQVAFMIVVESYVEGDPTPNVIANTLAQGLRELLPETEGETVDE